MQRWTRIGNFALTDDPFETEAVRGLTARAMLGFLHEDTIEAQDLRRFLWELGYFDIHRMNQHEVVSTLEHCLDTGVVGVVPWKRMLEILFRPGSSGGRAQRDADAGGRANVPAAGTGGGKPPAVPAKPPPKAELAPVTRTSEVPYREREDTRQVRSKAVTPQTLAEAVKQLAMRREEIKRNGAYKPKYSDRELLAMAQHGNVAGERFQVRLMPKRRLQGRDKSGPLTGSLGGILDGVTGKGAKYWSTSFDQLEDADTDQRLLCEKMGVPYDPKDDFVLVIVDTQKMAPLTAVASISATFEKVGKFAYTERPQDFTKAFTDVAMTDEFQTKYAKYYKDAVASGEVNPQKLDADDFDDYLETTGLSAGEIKILRQRMDMHKIIGNNEEYVGNGVTKNLIAKSQNQFGAVETLNHERVVVNLQQLQDAGAIAIMDDLTPLPRL